MVDWAKLSVQLYVKETFSADAKTRALDVVQKVRALLRDEMSRLEWMDPETRKNAIATTRYV